MSITDELRKWAEEFWEFSYSKFGDQRNLIAIADRIDAEHERVTMNVMNDALYYANEDDMAEHGWVRLPVDADGEVIHVGDMMERMERCGKVVALQLSDNPWGDGNHWAIQLEGENAPTVLDAFFRHHKPPTVEDVLREFAQDCLTYATNVDDHEVVDAIEKYAERLQLKESE